MKHDLPTSDLLIQIALSLGATRAAVIPADLICTDRSFRDMCLSNACGKYGKCWMCPPDVGDIDELMQCLKSYDHALVYQIVATLEDSFDFEGMMEARVRASVFAQKLRDELTPVLPARNLHLSVGGCGVCKTCTKPEGKPCRHPHLAMPSLEAYGVNVSLLAKAAGMKYINGQDTVTYFGAVLFEGAEA